VKHSTVLCFSIVGSTLFLTFVIYVEVVRNFIFTFAIKFYLFRFIVGVVIFYICIVVYLYGDLAIYSAAVPKSLRDVIW